MYQPQNVVDKLGNGTEKCPIPSSLPGRLLLKLIQDDQRVHSFIHSFNIYYKPAL